MVLVVKSHNALDGTPHPRYTVSYFTNPQLPEPMIDVLSVLFLNKIYLPFLEDSIENKVYDRFDLFAHTLFADFVIHKNPPK